MRVCVATVLAALAVWAAAEPVAVGSKKFTESYVLGEIATRTLQERGIEAEHRQGMGATSIVWEALKSGQIAAYPEYTGTIVEEILKSPRALDEDGIRAALRPFGVGMGGELGFNNTYALVMRRKDAAALGIRAIGDLAAHPDLRVKVSHEFLAREKDGWPPLSARYGLSALQAQGIDHGIAYEALRDGQIDVTDAYSTDAKIGEYDLVVLDDDRQFFPAYQAVFLFRLDAPESVVEALKSLEGTIDEATMVRLNGIAEAKDFGDAASVYLHDRAGIQAKAESESVARKIFGLTLRHLQLVGISLGLAVLLGIPLGIRASRGGWFGQAILGTTGVVQTIPSLALLALLVPIPLLGISTSTAVLALFLYSLLPIVRNTATGLQDISPGLRESAEALGLEPGARLRKVYLPMASRSILAGVKTSAILNIGTATLAALIAQGGLGDPIIAGLAVNRADIILQGALPAAGLALLAQGLFEGLDKVLIPKGLRLK